MGHTSAMTRLVEKHGQLKETLLFGALVSVVSQAAVMDRSPEKFTLFDWVIIPSSVFIWLIIYRLALRPILPLLDTGDFVSSEARATARDNHPFIYLGAMWGQLALCVISLGNWNSWIVVAPGILIFASACHLFDLCDDLRKLFREESTRPSFYSRLRFACFLFGRSIRYILAEPKCMFDLPAALKRIGDSLLRAKNPIRLTCLIGLVGIALIVTGVLPGNRLGKILFVTGALMQLFSALLFKILQQGLMLKCTLSIMPILRARQAQWSQSLRGIKEQEDKRRFVYMHTLAYRVFWTQLVATVITALPLVYGFPAHEFWVWLMLTAQCALTVRLYVTARNIYSFAIFAARFGEWEMERPDVSMVTPVAEPPNNKEEK